MSGSGLNDEDPASLERRAEQCAEAGDFAAALALRERAFAGWRTDADLRRAAYLAACCCAELVRLAELRTRQGRLAEARSLLAGQTVDGRAVRPWARTEWLCARDDDERAVARLARAVGTRKTAAHHVSSCWPSSASRTVRRRPPGRQRTAGPSRGRRLRRISRNRPRTPARRARLCPL